VDASSTVHVVATDDGSVRSLPLKTAYGLTSVRWTSDGQHFYLTGIKDSGSAYAFLYGGLDGKVKVTDEVWRRSIYRPVPSPDGHYLAFSEKSLQSNVVMLENF
jgi:hypothetical protein